MGTTVSGATGWPLRPGRRRRRGGGRPRAASAVAIGQQHGGRPGPASRMTPAPQTTACRPASTRVE